MQRETAIVIGVSITSTVIGAVSGYFYTKRQLRDEYEAIAQEEIEQAKNFYSALNKKVDFETPTQAAEKLIPAEERVVITDETASKAAKATAIYQGMVSAPKSADVVEEIVVAEETTNIFVNGEPLNPDDFDLEEERNNRVNGFPHIVTKAEYDENECDNEQQVLTYFSGDDTLVDEDEKPIDRVEETVGVANLQRFGAGSEDPNIVYIRNDSIGVDFEILLSRGLYSEEVLGLTTEDELAHSSMLRRSRRVYDE